MPSSDLGAIAEALAAALALIQQKDGQVNAVEMVTRATAQLDLETLEAAEKAVAADDLNQIRIDVAGS